MDGANAADEALTAREAIRIAVTACHTHRIDGNRAVVKDGALVRVVGVQPAKELLLLLLHVHLVDAAVIDTDTTYLGA